MYLYLKAASFVVMTFVKSILVIKSGCIKIFLKCMTNVLSNPTNYQFLMNVPRKKIIFTTFVKLQHDMTYSRQDLKTKMFNFSQITQIYRIKDNTTMFHDSQRISLMSQNKLSNPPVIDFYFKHCNYWLKTDAITVNCIYGLVDDNGMGSVFTEGIC